MAELRVVVTGGGSGGHITPLLAVAHELKQLQPACRIIAVGQRGDGLGDVLAQDPSIDVTHTVMAGKLRRYHGAGLRQLLDVRTMLLNLRDGCFVVIGLVQSYLLLRRLRPQVVFVKGGFVGVPVGLAAAALRIPYVTHDSDAVPGLANRIIARWAARHAVALPAEVYPYPKHKTVTVGVPISRQFRPVDDEARKTARIGLGLTESGRALLVTGGGLGAQRLNDAMVAIAPDLLVRYPDLTILHLAGRAHEAHVSRAYGRTISSQYERRVQVVGFTKQLHVYSAAADVVVMRAGGTAIAELAAQAKPCVLVPNPQLTGGHQLRNAEALERRQAVRVADDSRLPGDPAQLFERITGLLDDPAAATRLGKTFAAFANQDAARSLASLLLAEAGKIQGTESGADHGTVQP